MTPLRVAVLASTNGTVLPALLEADYNQQVEFTLFLTNKPGCGAEIKAKAAGVPCFSVQDQAREKWDKETLEILQKEKIDLLVLVGFMRILGPTLIEAFPSRILNVHPSLLPKFAGGMNLDVHAAALAAGERETGATVHIVTEELDAGPIVLQAVVPVTPHDTPDSLKQKVQELEKQLYPEAIRKISCQ